jgi:hypothetical protein
MTSNFSNFFKKPESTQESCSFPTYKEPNYKDSEIKSTTVNDEGLITYYCSLCGANVIITNSPIESFPRRKTDESIIALCSKIYFKSFLKRDKLIVVKRDNNKYEKQFRFVCGECGVFVAYQSINYEEHDTTDELKRRSNKIFSQNKKKIMYILIDAVVADPRQSSLFIEMEKLKETQDKKLMAFGKVKKLDA